MMWSKNHTSVTKKSQQYFGIIYVKKWEYLKTNVKVKEANGSLFSKFILFLYPSHFNDTQTLWLSWKGLHAQWLKAVLNTNKSLWVKTVPRCKTTKLYINLLQANNFSISLIQHFLLGKLSVRGFFKKPNNSGADKSRGKKEGLMWKRIKTNTEALSLCQVIMVTTRLLWLHVWCSVHLSKGITLQRLCNRLFSNKIENRNISISMLHFNWQLADLIWTQK